MVGHTQLALYGGDAMSAVSKEVAQLAGAYIEKHGARAEIMISDEISAAVGQGDWARVLLLQRVKHWMRLKQIRTDV